MEVLKFQYAVPVGASVLFLAVALCVGVLCCICCPWCSCCPCNRRRRISHSDPESTRKLRKANVTSLIDGHGTSSICSPAVPPRDTGIYVLPNNMVNDGSQPSSSWCMEETQNNNQEGVVYKNQAVEPTQHPYADKPWFFGAISRSEAEYLLSVCGEVGCFLFRSATNSADDVCLSMLGPPGGVQFRHLLVIKNEHNKYKISSLPADGDAFASISDLIDFYVEHEIHFHDSGPSVALTQPCSCTKLK